MMVAKQHGLLQSNTLDCSKMSRKRKNVDLIAGTVGGEQSPFDRFLLSFGVEPREGD